MVVLVVGRAAPRRKPIKRTDAPVTYIIRSTCAPVKSRFTRPLSRNPYPEGSGGVGASLRAPDNTAWGTDLWSVSRRAGGPSPRVLIQVLSA